MKSKFDIGNGITIIYEYAENSIIGKKINENFKFKEFKYIFIYSIEYDLKLYGDIPYMKMGDVLDKFAEYVGEDYLFISCIPNINSGYWINKRNMFENLSFTNIDIIVNDKSYSSYISPLNDGHKIIAYCEGERIMYEMQLTFYPIAVFLAAEICNKGPTDKSFEDIITELKLELEGVMNRSNKHLIPSNEDK